MPSHRRAISAASSVERLEERTLWSSTLLPFGDHRAAVYDPNRSMLYVATDSGQLARYDARNDGNVTGGGTYNV